MYSYNNIIEKEEPKEKDVIDSSLDELAEIPKTKQYSVGTDVDCIVVEHFLTDTECDALLIACETVGYSFWKQKKHDDPSTAICDSSTTAVREVDTIEANFPKLSKKLFDRIQSSVHLAPKRFRKDMERADELYERDLEGEWVPDSMSENLLLGRYGPGGHFMPHIDGSTIVDLNKRSFYTVLVYLNDCPAGGETFLFSGEQQKVMVFDDSTNKYRGSSTSRIGAVQPKKGSAAFFYYDLLHEGSPVVEGKKYICRADLMYRREPPILTGEKDLEAFQLYQDARLAESSGNAEEACRMFRRVSKLSSGVAELFYLN